MEVSYVFRLQMCFFGLNLRSTDQTKCHSRAIGRAHLSDFRNFRRAQIADFESGNSLLPTSS